ncbi:MAG: glycosyltransferase family 4 protein [Candidatus Thiocaldithrix dubininis]|uniref:Glycosyltransferase family 4 protein n=1 Tax=Candidatus Thiocaldithrix dubininis TaxID=3080823 RepID=A0AA95KEP1_9GAMM|nr:MAG: glycosyltransferase family 4 protein [Candidatus Thiocaldithrix dubininis]
MHQQLAKHIKNYKIIPYSPKLSLFPFAYYPIGRKETANLIHCTPDSAIFHLRRNVPMVVTLHGYAIDKELHPYSSLVQKIHGRTDLRWLHQLAVKYADVLTTVSQYTANLAQQDLNIKEPIKVIYNGVDEQLFFPKKRNIVKEIKVLFSGNLTRRKGADLLLPIIERLDKNITIYYTSGLREKSKLLDHPRLYALGNIPHKKMPELYRNMDILLFPTVREGHSIAVLEAMASGLPVVASNVASLPEQIIHGHGGFLCTLGDVNSFASAIQNLADDITLRKFLGDFNRAEVEKNFTLKNMINDYNKVFSLY